MTINICQHFPTILTPTQVSGFGLQVLEGVDPKMDNLVGAGIIVCEGSQIGCLLRLEPSKQAQVRSRCADSLIWLLLHRPFLPQSHSFAFYLESQVQSVTLQSILGIITGVGFENKNRFRCTGWQSGPPVRTPQVFWSTSFPRTCEVAIIRCET